MIPMPPRIEKLPRDERGYPIPWNVLRDVDGKPIFTANDSAKHMRAIYEALCPICGERTGKWKWFVGGPKSAFDPNGWYFDLPGHRECMEYALQVCPYLAAKNYAHRIDIVDPSKVPGVIMVDETQDPNRPLLFVAVASAMIELKPNGIHLPYVRPGKPWLGVSYWQKGKRLSDSEGEALVKEALSK
jgi:hypothetical protein